MGKNVAGGDGGAEEPPKPAGAANGIGAGPPPFLSKTYDMVDDPETDAIVSWGPDNNSFVVWNHPEFARDLLPKYFKHNNFSSFVRQLNTYGFRKVDPDRWEFANEDFLRGQKHLLKRINRRKSSSAHSQPPQQQVQNTSVGACVEVGKFGLEEEVERLKRDKNVLMQELVRLRQQQQTTDEQLQSLTKRLQGMEHRQQQMMSFLAKAMQSPGFLAQFVQQNDNSRRIVGVSKKRRLPKHENNFEGSKTSPDGQIVKYQPLMNEAAKAMLMKILQMDTSPRLDHTNTSDNFLLENAPSPHNAIESASLATRTSGVTLAEVPTSSGNTIVPSSTSIPVFPPTPVSDLQPAAGVPRLDNTTVASSATSDVANTGLLASVSETNVQGQSGMGFPEFSSVEEMVSDDGVVNIPISDFSISGSPTGYPDPISVGLDDLEEDSFSADTDMNILLEESSKLPGINDSFWEQFLISSPISGDADDNMAIQDGIENAQAGHDGWDGVQNMDHLTEKMGLLTSESQG